MSSDHACPYCPAVFKWGEDADSPLGVRAGNEKCGSNAYWKLRGHVDEKHPTEGHRCPRRLEVPFLPQDKSNDWWMTPDGHRACSHCGSMHPDDLFAQIEAGALVIGTDKNYKIYCDVPSPVAGQVHVTSISSHPYDGGEELTEALCDQHGLSSYERTEYIGKYVKFQPRSGIAHLKFYFQHLDAAGQDRFIALYNDKKIKLDRFGLYRTPYFATPAGQPVER
ncbi:hypothetical protein HAP48_0042535 [Bradyrhizobium septentrionale]|uniref:Uncharacterized protein n=1 Tax=Bradyrhizobium septentrionale TaxID=1404411 RepID=A0A973W2I5_9BRAD|nr:hypothetical protein [Bradyrhizobium septentrionale]UGY15137.1 hypothetical protein HAP48_0042535 [Bradyrhizobium septentrionale]